MWYEIAERLGMSVARCKAEISSAEYLGWCIRISTEPERKRREFRVQAFEFAHLKAELRRVWYAVLGMKKESFDVSPNDMLLEWESKPVSQNQAPPKKTLSKEEEMERGIAESRGFWRALKKLGQVRNRR